MKPRLCLVATACALMAAGGPAFAADGTGIDFKFSGFGTLGLAHTNFKLGDVTGDVFQPNGVGLTKSTSFGLDSKLGVQLSAKFNDQLSAVVQVISQHQEDNSYTPKVEWANVRYAFTPEFSVRLGRIALPAFLTSESRYVGYASPWSRPPIEVYGVLPITINDGVDATYRHALAGGNNAVQVYAGGSTLKFTNGGNYDVKSKNAWGINDTYETGALTLRAGYNALTLDIANLASGMQLLGAFPGVAAAMAPMAAVPGVQPIINRLNAIPGEFNLYGMKLSAVTLGVNYDPGDWFITAEAVRFKGEGFMAGSKAGMVGGGWRINGFTPYAYFAETRSDMKPAAAIDTTALAAMPGTEQLVGGIGQLMVGLNMTQYNFVSAQKSIAFGVRWDVMKNVALKAQFERQTYGVGDGYLKMVPMMGTSPNGHSANVVSLTGDFVF